MIEQFTVEEINLMCVFNTSSRDNLITDINKAMEHFEEDIAEIAENVLHKIGSMNDLEYNEIEMFPI